MRVRYVILPAVAAAMAGLWLANTSLLAQEGSEAPLLIAHRGLGQTFHREGLTGETCTAERIFPPEHEFLENTIDGFRAAFKAGADIVEFDVHPTTDGHFVVFHDWTLDCRTNGSGITRQHSLAELKALDIGYGYTADGGKTFPFRGKGVGLMPSLEEVLAAFPDKRFLINIKSDDENEGRMLGEIISRLPTEQRTGIIVYGGGRAMVALKTASPGTMVLGTDGAIHCLLRYAALGWSGYVPEDCRETLFMLPANVAPFAWGYPHRLAERLKAHGSMLVMLGDTDGTRHSAGIDDEATLAKLPARFDGAIWTNRIDRIGPLVNTD